MENLFLWRLELENGKGYYQALDPFDPASEAPAEGDGFGHYPRTPLPFQDGLPQFTPWGDGGEWGDRHIFGFTTIAAARSWFPHAGALAIWSDEGGRLAAYPRKLCKDIQEGRHQCVFIPPPGRLKKRAVLPAVDLWQREENELLSLVLHDLEALL